MSAVCRGIVVRDADHRAFDARRLTQTCTPSLLKVLDDCGLEFSRLAVTVVVRLTEMCQGARAHTRTACKSERTPWS